MTVQSLSIEGAQARPRLNFQQHLADLKAAGLLVEIDRPINKDTELHPFARLQFVGNLPENDRRAFLFRNVVDSKGRRYDIPVAVGALAASPLIYAIGMGQTVDGIGPAWLRATANPIPPIHVENNAPCQELIFKGDDLKNAEQGIARLPVPISTPGFDAAPYLTATLCTTRDPDTRVQNMGTYRVHLKAPDRVVVRMWTHGSGGFTHWCKYRNRNKPMPCAIVLGAAPVLMFTGAQKLPIGVDEAAVAGGLAGVPVPLVKCVTQDIDVPANSEIVIEGFVDTSCAEPEGPFGESHGHISLEMYNMPMTITAITQKRTPVLPSIISQVTPSKSAVVKKVAYEPMFFSFLRESLGIKGLKKVIMHERLSNLRPVNFLQFEYGVANTEVWRALRGAASWRADCGKIVIAVSEDIDPSNADAVMWSLAYRSNPVDDVQVDRYRAIGHYPKAGEDRPNSTMMINATLRGTLPPVALPARQFMESAKAIWDELKMPSLSLQQPWHGYNLGDWSQTWDRYAERAIAGEWQDLGRETALQQKADVALETLISRREI